MSAFIADINSQFQRLREFQRVIYLHAKIPHCAFQFGMAQQELAGPQIAVFL